MKIIISFLPMSYARYEFDENDVHDVKLLCETFHIEVPNEYR